MRRWFWAGAVAALGCARAQQPLAVPPISSAKIEIPAATAGPKPTPVVTEATPALAEIREPSSTACRIAEKAWTFTTLRLRDGGAVFASVSNAPTTLVIPAGEPSSVTAVFDDAHVRLRAIVAKNEVSLHARTASALKAFLVPKPRTALRWSGGAPGTLRLGVDAKAVLSWPELVEDDVSCEKIGLNIAEFSPRDLVTQRAKLPEREVAREGAELFEKRGSAPVARLRNGVRVELVQSQGKESKILIEEPSYTVFGWVASSDLRPPGMAAGYGTGYGRLGGRHVSNRGGRVCARDLTLIAENADERAKVGVLKKGAPFDVVSAEPSQSSEAGEPPARSRRQEIRYVAVAIPRTRWLALAEKARLLVPEDEYRECDPPPAAPPAPQVP